jgi:hypothetical protein
MLARLWPSIARTPELRSEPTGAAVSYKDYATPDAAWVLAGVTPLQGVRVPAGVFRWRSKRGFYLEVGGASEPLAQRRAVPGHGRGPRGRVRVSPRDDPDPGSDEPGLSPRL